MGNSYIDRVEFTTQDDIGNSVIVVAEREVILAIGGTERLGRWQYKTKNDEPVRFDEMSGHYVNESTGAKLVTTDPNEPKD